MNPFRSPLAALRLQRLLPLAVLMLVVVVGYGGVKAGTWLVVSSPIEDPQAIVVLASHEWERLPAAAMVARQHPRALVLLTQPGTVNDTTCYRCAERPWTLVSLDVSADRIRIMPSPSSNTYEEALAALDFAQATNLHRIAVVTSPYHARRALATFRQVFRGSSVTVGIHPALAESGAHPDSWWRTPYDRTYVVYEIAASIAYWFRYRISVLMVPATLLGFHVSRQPF